MLINKWSIIFFLVVAIAIYFKPVAHRYSFETIKDGYVIKDTATAKIYICNLSKPETVKIYNVLKNIIYNEFIEWKKE